MNSLDDSGAIFRYHRDMITMHGKKSSFALGWRSADDQLLRFDVLTEIANLDNKTILDAGCGYGDLFTYLDSRYKLSGYCGIEQIPELLDEAIHRHGHLPGTSFISGNFLSRKLPIADYVFASGSLNYGSNDPGFIFNAISSLFALAGHGLGFNLLHSVSPNGLLVAYEPELILAHCRLLTPNVALRSGYSPEDFTVFLYK